MTTTERKALKDWRKGLSTSTVEHIYGVTAARLLELAAMSPR